jgi:hypothetical protein
MRSRAWTSGRVARKTKGVIAHPPSTGRLTSYFFFFAAFFAAFFFAGIAFTPLSGLVQTQSRQSRRETTDGAREAVRPPPSGNSYFFFFFATFFAAFFFAGIG